MKNFLPEEEGDGGADLPSKLTSSVARFMVYFMQQAKEVQQATVMEWIRWSRIVESKDSRCFMVPLLADVHKESMDIDNTATKKIACLPPHLPPCYNGNHWKGKRMVENLC